MLFLFLDGELIDKENHDQSLLDLKIYHDDFITFCNKNATDQLAAADDQGASNTCVRFSLSKAVANALFLQHKIDIEQNNIMICLVQERKELCNPLAPTNPTKFNETVLYLQDKGNNIPGLQNQRCWWKVSY
jgi:hypothetical protein